MEAISGDTMAGEGAPRFLQPRRFVAAAGLLALALSGCGIQTVVYYDPPDVSFTSNQLFIEHDSSNSTADYFLGYEIYYRVFEDETVATNIGAAIYSSALSTSTSPDYLLSQLTGGTFPGYSGQVFYKMTNQYGADPLPLLPWTTGTNDFDVTILAGDWLYRIGSGSQNPVMRSSTFTSGSVAKSFYESSLGTTWRNDDYATDDDYEGSTVDGTTNLYLVAFSVAYGFGISSSIVEITSMPAVFYDTTYDRYAIVFSAH